MAPQLKIPVALDMEQFRQSAVEAKSRASETRDFVLRQLGNMAIKSQVFDLPRLIENSDGAKRIVQTSVRAIAQDVGNIANFAAQKVVPNVLENSVKSTAAAITTVGIPAATGFASALLPLIIRGLAIYAAFRVLSSGVEALSRDLEKMVEIAKEAQGVNVTPQFFQAFTKAGGDTETTVKSLSESLNHFFQSSKHVLDLNKDAGELEIYKHKWQELETTIRGVREILPESAQGPGNFVRAQLNDDTTAKAQAVLQTMKELFETGQKLEALNLGEKAFGSKFADDLRTGKIVFDEFFEKYKQLQSSGVQNGTIFSDENVNRSKQLSDELDKAWHTIAVNLNPSMQAFFGLALDVKEAWVKIVELMAKASALLPGAGSSAADTAKIATLRAQETLLKTRLEDRGLTDLQRRGVEDQLGDVRSRIAQAELKAGTLDVVSTDPGADIGANVPLPQRRPINIPKAGDDSSPQLQRDRFESLTDAIQKRTAMIEAETNAIDLNTEAREKAKIAAELEAVAKQVNARAGLGENVVTDEQRETIERLAQAYGQVAAAAERARSPLATFAREARDSMKNLEQVIATSLDGSANEFARFILGQQKFSDAIKSIYNRLLTDLTSLFLKEAILGPLAGQLHNVFSGGLGGGTNLIGQLLGSIGIGALAGGTDNWRGGWTVVGEKGPELLNLPGGSQVIPNHRMYEGSLALASASSDGGGARRVSISAPVTIIAPDPASFRQSSAMVSRSITAAMRGAQRYV